MDNETPTGQSDSTAVTRGILKEITEEWRTGSRGKAIILALLLIVVVPYSVVRTLLVEKFFWVIVLVGMGLTAIVALGQCWSIGYHAAWKIYKYWWLASPLFGPAFLAATLVPVGLLTGVEWLIGRLGKPQYAKVGVGIILVSSIAIGLFWGSYYGTLQDNPMLSSQPANSDALNKAVGDQNRVLSNLSESGKTLLGRLNATETELENAKKQLSATLLNFEAQRQAAGRVSEELKGLDARQTQIALQTEALERILDGQRPLTRQDLQRANWNGQIWGFFIGFAASLLASIAFSAFKKRKVT
jgi:hypothetical protein